MLARHSHPASDISLLLGALGGGVVKFDGWEIKQMRCLPRAVAETSACKHVIVLLIRKGKEETETVMIGRLEN
jgi:serine protease Do